MLVSVSLAVHQVRMKKSTLTDVCHHLLIITPDTARSRAAMRAEVPTDRPRAKWERDGGGGGGDTSARQGETTAFHSCYLPPEEY